MIPKFPEFKKIEISDEEIIRDFTHSLPPYSDFDFVTLWSWDVGEDRGISELNENLVVRFSDYLTGETFYSFWGNNHLKRTVEKLFEFALDNKHSTDLRFIAQHFVPAGFGVEDVAEILEDPDNHDYIYLVEDLVNYKGPQYAQARNLLSRFHRRNGEVSIRDIDLGLEKDKKLVLDVSERWQRNKGKYVTREGAALRRLIDQSAAFKLISFGVMIDGIMAAYAISEVLHDGYAISHFVQADVSHPGLYSFIMQEIAKRVAKEGCVFLNYEQDLGLPGLRQAKKSYHPTHLLKKYAIVSKEGYGPSGV